MTSASVKEPIRRACVAALACLGASAVFAEGAVKTLECSAHSVCDAAGQCAEAAGDVTFRVEPVQVVDGGAGSYLIHYDGVRADMQADSEFGPYFWMHGSERHSLIVSSESQWLWHALQAEPAPVATIRFLECRLTL